MRHQNLMIVGTASGVGKSATVTALCRIFQKDGYRVCPFKSQNMALNSYVTKDGEEMGRAQAVQAEAIGLEPQVWMNPILLKPSSNKKIQIIIEGKSIGNLTGPVYHQFKKALVPRLVEIYQTIENNYDISVLEGAGSPAEINMLEEDISNFGMAKIADAPVLLVADIDKGGVFASIYGTIMLLSKDDRKRVKGVLINKFRGNPEVLQRGVEKIEELTGVPVLGILPYGNFDLEEEDSLTEKYKRKKEKTKNKEEQKKINIAIIQVKHLSNMTDFDVLRRLEEVELYLVSRPEDLGEEDIIILPGSKNTIEDYLDLQQRGFIKKIKKAVVAGKMLIGICGGFQMLGKKIEDPYEVETEAGSVETLGLLPMTTVLEKGKYLSQYIGVFVEVKDALKKMEGVSVKAYEIHQGISHSSSKDCMGEDRIVSLVEGNVWGTYLHGIFDNSDFVEKLLESFQEEKGMGRKHTENFDDYRERQWQSLEDMYRQHANIEKIYEIMGTFEKRSEEQ